MTPYEMTKVVHAEQLSIENAKTLADLVHGKWQEEIRLDRYGSTHRAHLTWWRAGTANEADVCRPGDYVVQEPDGSYHAWDRDVFEGTFQPQAPIVFWDGDPLRTPGCF